MSNDDKIKISKSRLSDVWELLVSSNLLDTSQPRLLIVVYVPAGNYENCINFVTLKVIATGKCERTFAQHLLEPAVNASLLVFRILLKSQFVAVITLL